VTEHYVRPPLVAREPGSRTAATVRFWLVFGLFVAALAVGILLLYQLVTSAPGEGSPGINPQGAAATQPLR
jgi:hypothetical protein